MKKNVIHENDNRNIRTFLFEFVLLNNTICIDSKQKKYKQQHQNPN